MLRVSRSSAFNVVDESYSKSSLLYFRLSGGFGYDKLSLFLIDQIIKNGFSQSLMMPRFSSLFCSLKMNR